MSETGEPLGLRQCQVISQLQCPDHFARLPARVRMISLWQRREEAEVA